MISLKRIDKGLGIALFFIIAILIRYCVTIYKPSFLLPISDGLFYAVLTGTGPFIGGLVAIYLLGRRTRYSSFGTSFAKSLVSIALPILLFCLLDVIEGDWQFTYTKIVTTCLLYAYFEEYGWRGYLQSELINFHKWCRILVIAMMWFVWHLNFEWSIGNLLFFALLFLGSWGIGQIAIKSQSIIACACFHSVINTMQNIDTTVATFVIIFLCIIAWFWLWYGKWCLFFK